MALRITRPLLSAGTRGTTDNAASSLPAWVRGLLKAEPDEKQWLRYPKDMHTRTPANPHIPGGAAHKLSANYYFTRDTRRAEKRIFRIGNTEATPLMLETGSGEDAEMVASVATGPVFPSPRKNTKWSLGDDAYTRDSRN